MPRTVRPLTTARESRAESLMRRATGCPRLRRVASSVRKASSTDTPALSETTTPSSLVTKTRRERSDECSSPSDARFSRAW